MDALAIIPVKSFEGAKSRLDLSRRGRKNLCELMLREVLGASLSSGVSETVVVTGEARAAEIASGLGASVICDASESGVNDAVSLADGAASTHDASIVLPQDIPLVEAEDIDCALAMAPRRGVLVVPSSRLDGTNALVRAPPSAIATHYDEDSYRIHMSTTRSEGLRATLGFVRRIMLDVDTRADLELVAGHCRRGSAKPDLARGIGQSLAM